MKLIELFVDGKCILRGGITDDSMPTLVGIESFTVPDGVRLVRGDNPPPVYTSDNIPFEKAVGSDQF
jgi:hypothetical protein